MLKIKAWDDNKEVVIPISDITGSVQRDRVIIELTQELRDNPVVTLPYSPQTYGETIYVNGIAMTEGSQYDYTIVLNVITFNVGILPKKGHILINYTYE